MTESARNCSPRCFQRSDITFTINLDSKIDISAFCRGFALRRRLYRKISDLTVNLRSCGFNDSRTRLMRIQFPNTNLFKVFNLSSLPTIDSLSGARIETSGPFANERRNFLIFCGHLSRSDSPPSPFPDDGLW